MVAVAMDDHRFGSAFDACLDFNQATVGDGIQRDQGACVRCLMVMI